LLNLVRWHQRAFKVTAADRATQIAAVGFDAAVWELWPYLTAGASVHLADEAVRSDPTALRDWLVAERITITFVPTLLAQHLVALPWPHDVALRYMLTGADALHVRPPADLPFALVNNYGPTECAVVATSGPVCPAGQEDGLPPIGRPIDNVRIYLLDSELHPVPVGAPGELCIGGAGVGRGYVNRPELTAERFVLDPFSPTPGARLYRTGDLARRRPDGQFVFLGRIDDQIKIRGFRVEPAEIAARLDAHPDVTESAVVASHPGSHDPRLVAYVVPVPGTCLTRRGLQEFLGLGLPDYMVPSVFVRLDALPVTANGKIDRTAFPDPTPERVIEDGASVEPRTVVEERIAQILAPLLGLPRVGVEDNFFLLGGHSLLGTQLIARIRDAFGVDLSLRHLFESPTTAGLAAEVERCLIDSVASMTDDEAERLLAAESRSAGGGVS
jgi:acyl-coenzyme A synthetase/AMP-(fatty) acid ligase/acyl carrier protein